MGDDRLTMVDSLDGLIGGNELSSQIEKIAPDLWEKFLSRENFELAWDHLAKKKTSAGIDKVSIPKFAANIEKNIDELIGELRDDRYNHSPYRQIFISKGEGKGDREIKIATVRDRLVQRALLNVVSPIIDPLLSPNTFAYREGKCKNDAINQCYKLKEEGYQRGLKADIQDFFGSINHSKLVEQLSHILPKPIIEIIRKTLGSEEKGLPQGSALSPLLANLYINSFDKSIEIFGVRLIRYADDFLLLAQEPLKSYKFVENLLNGLDLKLNNMKTEEISFEEGFKFVGHNFIHQNQPTTDTVRIPARLFSHYGQCLKIWLFARWLDQSFGKGSGKVSFSIFDAGTLLNRGESTIRKYLAQASKKGLIRSFSTKNDQCTLFYTSLEKAVMEAGMTEMGPVASCPITNLEAIAITATEIEIAQLQKASFYAAIKAEKERGTATPTMISPIDLLNPPCELPARVLGKSDRWLYTSEGFIPYGGSQKSVATVREVTSRTVERHLSKKYRESPSPIKNYREGVAPLLKGQIAQRITRSRSKEVLAAAKYFGEAGKFFEMGDRIFERKCNVYAGFDFTLIRCRFRRRRLKGLNFPPEREREKFLF